MGYFDLKQLASGAFTKAGVRGFPRLEPVQSILCDVLREFNLDGVQSALDLTARGGAAATELIKRGVRVGALDASFAASSVLNASGLHDLNQEFFDLTCLILPGDRGNALVRNLIRDAFSRTRLGGRCVMSGDKDRGFERYFKEAVTLFGTGEIIERSNGLRVAVVTKTSSLTAPSAPAFEAFSVEARGQKLECAVLPGVFSSGKLDPASRLLLEHLPSGLHRTVLDIGSGYGVLAGFMALEGAAVTMLEDDKASVQSCHKMLALNQFTGRAKWSDVDSSIKASEKFDLIISNPPFHVGSDLILDVALEFIRCAERHLTIDGELWIVANHFLPYEPEMARIGTLREVSRAKGFKILKTQKQA